MWRTDKDVKSKGALEHLEKLERELKKNERRDAMLDAHLRRLKVGWGRTRTAINQVA